MPIWLRASALLLLGGSHSLAGQRPWPDTVVSRATLSFDGKSSLGDFTGTTTTVRGQMTGGPALTDVRGWVEAPVTSLKTGNDRRDRDLVKTMEAAIFPNIRFELSGVSVDWQHSDSAVVFLEGNFVIHGVSRGQRMKAAVSRLDSGVHLQAEAAADPERASSSERIGAVDCWVRHPASSIVTSRAPTI